MKISIDGGEPVRVMEQPATFPAISPDGKWLAYGFRNEETGEWLTGVMPFEGDEVIPAFDWEPGGKRLAFVRYKTIHDAVLIRNFR